MRAYLPLQCTRWLAVHGLSKEGAPCPKTACSDGKLRIDTRDVQRKNLELRCSKCGTWYSANGEFFKNYKRAHFKQAFMLLYGVVNRWRPQLLAHELQLGDRGRITAMIKHAGALATLFLSMLFKHFLGRWRRCVADEAATGQAKKHIGAKRPTQKGLRWWMSLAETIPGAQEGTWKVAAYFFEPMPKLATFTKEGLRRFKIKTKEHMTWQLVRLCGWGGKLITDSAKGYGCMGTVQHGGCFRPDVDHEDSNHSKGFNAPGPKSIAKGLTACNTNIIEGGGHGAAFKLTRGWLGCKIGKGSDEHETHVKDLVVAMRNWNATGQDHMQQMMLWLRFAHGNLSPTTLEVKIAAQLNLDITGEAPDWDQILYNFNQIDLDKEPWVYMVGPDMPVLTKEGTTKPAGLDAAWAAYCRSAQEEHTAEQEAHVAVGGEPPSGQPPPLSVPEVAAPFLFAERPHKRPKNKATERARKGKARQQQPEVPGDVAVQDTTGLRQVGLFGRAFVPPVQVHHEQTADVQFHPRHAADVQDAAGLRQVGLFGRSFVPPVGTKRKGPDAPVSFHPRHTAALYDTNNQRQPQITALFMDKENAPFFPPTKPKTPEQRAAKEETSRDGEARGCVVALDDTSPPAPVVDLTRAFEQAAAPSAPLVDITPPLNSNTPPPRTNAPAAPWSAPPLFVPRVDLTADSPPLDLTANSPPEQQPPAPLPVPPTRHARSATHPPACAHKRPKTHNARVCLCACAGGPATTGRSNGRCHLRIAVNRQKIASLFALLFAFGVLAKTQFWVSG